MKILMIAPQPFFEPRGTPFSVLGRLRALSELGHEVDLLTYHVGQDVAVQGVTIHRAPRVGFIKRVKVGPSLPKVLLDFLLLLKATGMLLRRRYDLLHTHEEASFFGVVLARLFRMRHLYDMHSSPSEQLSNFKVTKLRPLVGLFRWMESAVINASDAVITICPALEEHVRRVNDRVPQMMIENVAVERDPQAIPGDEVRCFMERHPSLQGKDIVLYAGTFEAYQGIDLLIASAERVIHRCENVVFLMVGGKPEQVLMYQDYVDGLGLSSHFYFTGSRPPGEIPLFLRIARVLASPRIDGTNTPLKVYSYLQSGKPIVATDLYTHTQVLNPEVSVLVEPRPDALAEGLVSVLEDTGLADALGQRARQHFEEHYTHSAYVEKTRQVLQMAVGR